MVTLYVDDVAPAMFTLFFFHWYVKPVPVLAVNVKLPPVHMATLPAGVTCAAKLPMLTAMALLVAVPHEAVAVTV